jgi:hypothetical protein
MNASSNRKEDLLLFCECDLDCHPTATIFPLADALCHKGRPSLKQNGVICEVFGV